MDELLDEWMFFLDCMMTGCMILWMNGSLDVTMACVDKRTFRLMVGLINL